MTLGDPYNLQRFVNAQADDMGAVEKELRQGRKETHWMWFVFPQIAGLGGSATAMHYAIRSLDEAKAYLAHAILGQRLVDCTELILATEGRSIDEIFGAIDSLKFRSCMTLFAAASPQSRVFQSALAKYFGGEADPLTLQRL